MKRFFLMAIMISAIVLVMAGQNSFANPPAGASLSGKVVDTMNSGGYTYVQLEKGGKKTWVAVPQMKVKKGQQLSLQPGVEMVNFESKTLKRKFEKIFFSAGPLN